MEKLPIHNPQLPDNCTIQDTDGPCPLSEIEREEMKEHFEARDRECYAKTAALISDLLLEYRSIPQTMLHNLALAICESMDRHNYHRFAHHVDQQLNMRLID